MDANFEKFMKTVQQRVSESFSTDTPIFEDCWNACRELMDKQVRELVEENAKLKAEATKYHHECVRLTGVRVTLESQIEQLKGEVKELEKKNKKLKEKLWHALM